MTLIVPARPVYIYALIDPRTDDVRYVGQTISVARRLQGHLNPSHLKRISHKNRWLKEVLAAGLRPVMRVLEETTVAAWGAAEQRWIAYYRSAGAPLTNLTDGGDGTLGYHFPDEIRRHFSSVNKGRPRVMTPEQRVQQGARARAWLDNPEIQERRRQALRGRRFSPEHCDHIAEARRNHQPSPEAIAARRERFAAVRTDANITARREAARIAACQTPEFRAKISAIQKGQTKSPEHRAKIGAAHKGKHTPAHVLEAMRAGKEAARARRQSEREAVQLCLFTILPQDA